MDLTQHTLVSLRDAIAAKKVSSVEATREYLERIAKFGPRINAFNELYADRAMERAKLADAGTLRGPLAGVPISIKDNLCTTWGRTTCSSKILANFKAPYDATVVKKLEAAG